MMRVIRSRESCDSGLGRYSRSGMYDAVDRKLFSSGVKRAISSGVNSAIAHKVADVVVNGKTVAKGTTSAGKKAVESVVNNAKYSTKKWIVGKKRSIQSLADPIILPQKGKLNIDSLIDGSSIVLD